MPDSKQKRKKDPFLFWLLIFAGAYFLFCYFTDPVRPANMFNWFGFHDVALFPKGWTGYNDQHAYLKLAHTLANFDWKQFPHTFLYGLGYPIVAVPFLWLGFSRDPFMLFDLFAFVFAVYATYKAGKHFLSPVGGMLAGFALAFATPLVTYVVQPWNTTVCLVTVSAILLVATAKKTNWRHFLLLGVLVGWVFAARYIDAAFLGLLALAALYRGSYMELLKRLVFFVLGLCVFVIPVLYAQNAVFGSPFKTPYTKHTEKGKSGSDQNLTSYSISQVPKEATATLVGPRAIGPSKDLYNRGLLVNMFWTLAAIPGAVILYRKSKQKLFIGTLIVFTLGVAVFYLSFRGVSLVAIKYGLLHYFKMLWPGAVIFAVAFFDNAFARTRARRPKPKKTSA